MRLLLHTCCGPCFLGVWEDLKNKDWEVTNYFYNPNIYPVEEYHKRLEGLQVATRGKQVLLVEGEYEPKEHQSAIDGKEDEFPGRCLHCYRLRLKKSAQYAKENGYDAFSTTLLVSPYQQHDELRRIGEEIGNEVGINFYYADFRPHFREGQTEARFIPIYKQKYCGCKYSLPESR